MNQLRHSLLGIVLTICLPVYAESDKKKQLEQDRAIQQQRKAQYQTLVESTQKIIVLGSSQSKKHVSSFLRKNHIHILAEGHTFFVIRPQAQMLKKDYSMTIKQLKKFKSVLSVKNDTVSFPLADSFLYINSCQLEQNPLGELEKKIKKVLQVTTKANEKDCHLFPHCQNNSNPAWAKMQIGADLAEVLVEESLGTQSLSKKQKLAATVAVVDSGFDHTNQRSGFNPLSFTIEKGHPTAGEPSIDPDGHGTAVSGMISGKGIGVTKNINLRFYRVTEKNANGGTTKGLLAAAIEKACEQSDIVNVSWGSLFDESEVARPEKELWYKKAVERGCLIIKAAGNSGVKQKEKNSVPIEAPFLSIAASDQFTGEAHFSTKGMLKGPGEGVYSLLSYQHEYPDFTIRNACKLAGRPIGPINGTSFAAPAVAGVAGQVLTILKARGVVPKTPSKKIALLKSILFASGKWNTLTGGAPGIVNALGASLIAKGINRSNMTNDIDQLIQIGQSLTKKECAQAGQDCTKKIKCEDKKTCIHRHRFTALTCVPPKENNQKLLFTALQNLKERELTTWLLARANTTSIVPAEIQKNFAALWQQNLDVKSKNKVSNIATALSILYTAQKSGLNNFITIERLREIVRTNRFSDIFGVDTVRGKNIWKGSHESQHARFIQIFKALSPKDQITFIQEIPNIHQRYHEGEMGLLYLFNQEDSALSQAVRETLKQRIQKVALDWFSGKTKFDYSGLSMQHNVPTFEMFLNSIPRGKELLIEKISKPPGKKNLHLYAFAMSSDNILSARQRLHIAQRTLQAKKDNQDTKIMYTLDLAAEIIIAKSELTSDHSLLKNFLIRNPLASLPLKATTDYKFSIKNQHRILGEDKNFWDQFISKNISRSIAFMNRSQQAIITTISTPHRNMFKALINNIFVDPSSYIQKHQDELESLFKLAAKNIVELKKISWIDPLAYLKIGSLNLIQDFLKNADSFNKAGFQTRGRRALEILKNDILSDPSSYPQSLRQQIRKYYGLKEER